MRLISYACAPSDSEGHIGRNGCFLVWPGNYHDAVQVADSHSPAFTRIKLQVVVGKNEATAGKDKRHYPDPDESRLTFFPSATQFFVVNLL